MWSDMTPTLFLDEDRITEYINKQTTKLSQNMSKNDAVVLGMKSWRSANAVTEPESSIPRNV